MTHAVSLVQFVHGVLEVGLGVLVVLAELVQLEGQVVDLGRLLGLLVHELRDLKLVGVHSLLLGGEHRVKTGQLLVHSVILLQQARVLIP